MKFNIVISATIFLLVAGCGEMRTPIDLESGSDSDATTNLETDCGDGVIQLGEACDGLNVGAMRCEYLGLGAGELNCASNCIDFDISACSEPAFGNQNDDNACVGSWIADGWCDAENNLVECSYDGGDCCPSTCQDGSFVCGNFPFDCVDPSSCENTGECEPSTSGSSESGTLDPAWCEAYEELCDYTYEEWCADYPDLCDVTYEEYCQVYPELCDPDYNAGACIASWVADGWCDPENNVSECGYDGGDCCPSTCESSWYDCGDYAFICIDPEACEVTGECEPLPTSGTGSFDPGWCEAYEELCDYTDETWCADYPELCGVTYEEYCQWYPEFCDDIDDCEQYPELCDPNYTYCVPEWAGDNDCDTYNNTAECGWDGGDCCVSTVGIYSSSQSYECLDPDACENSEAFCPSRDSVFCEGSPEYCYGYCLGNPDLCCPEGQSECPNSIVNARSRLTPESFVGVYERRPIENDWHLVEVVLEDGQLWWRNQAGQQWLLYYEDFYVRTGEDCPYGEQNLGIQLIGIGDDAYISELYGLRFNNSELYLRVNAE